MTRLFHGEGFSNTPLDGEEASRHRHMFQEVEKEWSSLDNAVTVFRAVAILYQVMKVGGPVLLICLAAGAFARAQGWI